MRSTRSPLFEDSGTVTEALGPEPTRQIVLEYLKSRRSAWGLLLLITGFVAIGLAYAGNQVGGNVGNTLGAALGFFAVGFCLGAELDAVWRYYYAKVLTQRTADDSLRAEAIARAASLVRADIASVILPLLGGLVGAGLFARGL